MILYKVIIHAVIGLAKYTAKSVISPQRCLLQWSIKKSFSGFAALPSAPAPSEPAQTVHVSPHATFPCSAWKKLVANKTRAACNTIREILGPSKSPSVGRIGLGGKLEL